MFRLKHWHDLHVTFKAMIKAKDMVYLRENPKIMGIFGITDKLKIWLLMKL